MNSAKPVDTPAAGGSMNGQASLLYPLDLIYVQAGLPLPQVSAVPGDEVPQPYRQLLVHRNDMTPTLEAFHGDRIHLQVTRRRLDGDAYWRQVVLKMDGSGQPVEFGAIVIYLQHFPPAAREQIMEGYTPLGTILANHNVKHTSAPRGFIRVLSDDGMNEALQLTEPQVLYGRLNLLAGEEATLAEVLEILPPLPGR